MYLRVSYDQALERVRSDELRPMLRRPDLAAVYQERESVYEAVSTVVVETDGRGPEEVARALLERLTDLR